MTKQCNSSISRGLILLQNTCEQQIADTSKCMQCLTPKQCHQSIHAACLCPASCWKYVIMSETYVGSMSFIHGSCMCVVPHVRSAYLIHTCIPIWNMELPMIDSWWMHAWWILCLMCEVCHRSKHALHGIVFLSVTCMDVVMHVPCHWFQRHKTGCIVINLFPPCSLVPLTFLHRQILQCQRSETPGKNPTYLKLQLNKPDGEIR
jgi:hypothetical protein